jgi:hypothetical protein
MKSLWIKRSALTALSLVLFSFAPATANNQPALSAVDRSRLAEAFRLGDQIGDRVWPGWSQTPFAVLLVTSDTEFLIRSSGLNSKLQLSDQQTLSKVGVQPPPEL